MTGAPLDGRAVAAALRWVAASTDLRRRAAEPVKVAMDPRSVARRLRTAARLGALCRRLTGAHSDR